MNKYIKKFNSILVKTVINLQTAGGKLVEVWELSFPIEESERSDILSAWAKHFREHYCKDSEIDLLRQGTGLSRKDYLRTLTFPDDRQAPGPSTRAGDFGEIFVADFLEFIENYEVLSRNTRYNQKTNRNESTQGSDVIAFHFVDSQNPNPKDELAIFEAKAKFTGIASADKTKKRLQDAIDDSAKDKLRIAQSLNAMKRRFIEKSMTNEIEKVQRFQNEADYPYKTINGAVALVCNSNYSDEIATNADPEKHPNKANLRLIVIKGEDMMDFVHELYRRAADEA
jgi:hypothetical protein